jgi:hypothetical protein
VYQKRFEIFASNATRGAQQPCRQEEIFGNFWTIGNFLKNAKYAPQPTANFLKIVENDSSHQNNNFRLIKTASNNLGEMERRTIEGKFSYHSCIIL